MYLDGLKFSQVSIPGLDWYSLSYRYGRTFPNLYASRTWLFNILIFSMDYCDT